MLDFTGLFKLRSNLIESINANDVKKIQTLLDDDNENKNETSFVNLNFIDNDGQTLMHRACRLGNLEIVKILVKYGASQNLKNKEGWFPIHFATYFGHYDIVKYLINGNNFQHQSLIAVYDDVAFSRVNLNFFQCGRNLDAIKTEEESSSESDSSTDSDITDDDEDEDDDGNNYNNLEDLVNDLDLNYLELNDSNEKLLLDELILNGSDLDSSLSFLPNSIQIQSKGNKFLSIF